VNGPIVKEGDEFVFVPSFSAENPTINFNGTLSGLAIGHHALLFSVTWSSSYRPANPSTGYYDEGTAGHEYSTTTYSNVTSFYVTDQPIGTDNSLEPNQSKGLEPFPTLIVVVAFSVAVVVAGLVVLLRKYK
jgi:hypothetical protein